MSVLGCPDCEYSAPKGPWKVPNYIRLPTFRNLGLELALALSWMV